MNEHAGSTAARLKVENFGPIISADLDLRPLTVFVGPSNTGKSYLATAIYALNKAFLDLPDVRMLETLGKKMPQSARDRCFNCIAGLRQHIEGSIINPVIDLPKDVLETVCELIGSRNDYLSYQLRRSFGVGRIRKLIRAGKSSQTRLKVSVGSFVHDTHIKDESCVLSSRYLDQYRSATKPILEGIEVEVLRRALLNVPDSDKTRETIPSAAWRFLNTLVQCLRPQMFGPLGSPVHYLPASRSGLMNTQRIIAGSMVSLAGFYEADEVPIAPMLTGVATDFIRRLIETDPASQPDSRLGIAEGIESRILGGDLTVEPAMNGGLPHFSYKPKGFKEAISLLSASSMVSELAPLVLYLRYFVRPSETLVIEEPESHLHPGMQVELIRQIARLVKEGVKILLTTHSEWMLESLSNLLHIADLPESSRAGLEDAGFALKPNQVGAWLFKPKRSPKGTIVEEIKFDPRAGGLGSDFDAVAEELYDNWTSIGSRVENSDH